MCRLLGGSTSRSRHPRPNLSLLWPQPARALGENGGEKAHQPLYCTPSRAWRWQDRGVDATQEGQIRLRKLRLALVTWDARQQLLSPLPSSQGPPAWGPAGMAAEIEEKGKGAIPHPRDFCLLRLLDLSPASDSLPASVPPGSSTHSFLSHSPLVAHTNSQVNSSTKDACFLDS